LFNRLSRKDMVGIVDIQLKRLEKLLAERKITIEVDEKAKAWLANRGYDPVYGARPLKRVIQTHLQNPLATMILEGKVQEGDTVLVSTSEDGALTINGEPVEGSR
ncbi:MAG: ATP-dependent chaperone ClpB, partial [Alphaproteobacteria bacterium]